MAQAHETMHAEEQAKRKQNIKLAKDAIGAASSDEHVLKPTEHAGELETKAPALARVLRTGKVNALARRYERYDQNAGVARKRFNRSSLRSNVAVFVTGVFCALIMVFGILKPELGEAVTRYALLALGAGTMISGGLAAAGLYQVRQGNLLEEWMNSRAKAEATRIVYFKTLVEYEDLNQSMPLLALLKLEYFRRYQLDMQLAYADQRSKRHQRATRVTLGLGSFAAALTSASGFAAFGASTETVWASVGALGVVGTALSSFTERQEAIFQDRGNANRLSRTLEGLEDLHGSLEEVRIGVADESKSQSTLNEYVAAVHSQISAAHREWLSSAETSRAAFDDMEKGLAEAQRTGTDGDVSGEMEAST